MNKTLTATLICALAAPALAGGPVLVEEEAEVVAERPASKGGAIVPLLLLLAVAVAVANSGGDTPCTPDSATAC